MNEIVIDIFEHSEGGYEYNIYSSPSALENGEEAIDGGLCTTTMLNALGMAMEQAAALVKKAEAKG